MLALLVIGLVAMVIKYIVDQVNRVNADMYACIKRLETVAQLKVSDIHSIGGVTIGSGKGKGSIFQGDADGNMTIMSKNNVVLAAATQSGLPDRVITVDPTGTISIVNPLSQDDIHSIKIIPGVDSVTIRSPNVIIDGDLEVRGRVLDNQIYVK
jgi:hypothetical protein